MHVCIAGAATVVLYIRSNNISLPVCLTATIPAGAALSDAYVHCRILYIILCYNQAAFLADLEFFTHAPHRQQSLIYISKCLLWYIFALLTKAAHGSLFPSILLADGFYSGYPFQLVEARQTTLQPAFHVSLSRSSSSKCCLEDPAAHQSSPTRSASPRQLGKDDPPSRIQHSTSSFDVIWV